MAKRFCPQCGVTVEIDSDGALTCIHGREPDETSIPPKDPPVVAPTQDSDHDDETPSHDDLGVSGAG